MPDDRAKTMGHKVNIRRRLDTDLIVGNTLETVMSQQLALMPKRQIIFAGFVVFVFGTSSFEIISEFVAGETFSEMADDLGRFGLSLAVLLIASYEYLAQKKALRELRQQLTTSRGRLASLEPKTVEIANQYRAVMQRQFDAWQLTESEQDVVVLMLKGLSFREIAQLRVTQEKTVRQQASAVYRKAGVASRNELAAWFFEDLLDPDGDAHAR